VSTTGFDPSTWPERLGVRRGETIQLMADLTRMAWNARRAGQRFDPNTLLDAFADAVGPEGMILVPTFNFDLLNGDAFDVRHTRSISGALANAALDHPSYRRTAHPLHSFAVADGEASTLEGINHAIGSFDPASPFGLMHRRKARLISFDLPLNASFTFVHYVEQALNVPYRRIQRIAVNYTDHGGTMDLRHFTTFGKTPGHVNELSSLEPLLHKAGALTQGELDGSKWISVDLGKAYDVVALDIQKNKARNIHRFLPSLWLRDSVKAALRRFGYRTRKERTAHAARLH
jgi:aminoglycoside N3'-acetyltransferase